MIECKIKNYGGTMIPRLSILSMLNLIDEPNRSGCVKLYQENIELFKKSHGSVHNHQAWNGGYYDHIEEVMNFGAQLFSIAEKTKRDLDFTLSDVLLVMFLHDLEKPWKYEINGDGVRVVIHELEDKSAQHDFRFNKLAEYGIVLNENQLNGMKYVEGERDYEYSPYERKSNRLAGLCHAADFFSARVFHDYPLEKNDPWINAKRCNS